MKIQQKQRIIQKLWGWICLAINILIITFFLSKKIVNFLCTGLLISVAIICYGFAKTLADRFKDNLSGTSVMIQYICMYVLTFLSVFRVSEYITSVSVLIVLVISCVLEFLVFLFITYWHVIRRFISNM